MMRLVPSGRLGRSFGILPLMADRGIGTALAEGYLRWLSRRGWVTWQRRHEPGGDVLMLTNAWPRADEPISGIFLQHTVDGLEAAGLRCDVLLVRGDRGLHCYLLGCVLMLLLSLTRNLGYELVNTHGGETALVGRFYFGAPVVATYWGSDLLGPGAGSRGTRVKQALRCRLLRAHARLMTGTTTKSHEMEMVLPASVRLRNRVIPDGVDMARFRPSDRAAARHALGWPEAELTVISVGRRVAVKRLWLAEQAVELARHDQPELRWRAIAEIPPASMPLVYAAADCLLHTSASEGSSNAIKEALACDLPVVATPAGDVRELLAGVEPSAVCAPEPEQIAHALIACLRAGTRSNGRERSSRLSSDQIAQRVLDWYETFGLTRPSARRVPDPA